MQSQKVANADRRSRKVAKIKRHFRSVPEVAEYLGVGADKVLAWIRTGDLTATDLSQTQGDRPRWYIAATELERFIAARQSVPTFGKNKPQQTTGQDILEFVK